MEQHALLHIAKADGDGSARGDASCRFSFVLRATHAWRRFHQAGMTNRGPSSPLRTFLQGGRMTKRWMIAALAAASVAATALPAAAQGGYRSWHEGWAHGNWDNWRGGPGFGFGVTIGAPAYANWGVYNDPTYGTYAADWSYGAPAYDYGYRDYGYRDYGYNDY